MNDPSDTPNPPKPAKPVQLRIEVLIDGTIIGKLKLGKGHQTSMDAEKAKALAGLTPPAVKIIGA